jgi:membrane-bound lytic murein transglycosylase F
LRVLATIVLCLLLGTCSPNLTLLEQVQRAGVLKVVTRNAPTTYYIGPEGPVGPEYELAKGFADYLGVALEIYALDNVTQILAEVAAGRVHVAAAALTAAPERQERLEYGPEYRRSTQQLVYRMGSPVPRALEQTYGLRIEVPAGSSFAGTLEALRMQAPGLTWLENPVLDQQDLLARVAAGDIDFTLADSTAVLINRFFHPEIRVAFDVGEPRPVAWAIRADRDRTLVEEAERYFTAPAAEARLAEIMDRYYGHTERFDYVGTRTFLQHIETRLPLYRALFEEAAAEHGFDWRLLAALSYQESHWDPQAVSPTGVRGLMMLTLRTAEAMGVSDREDPEQSIRGGAQYLRKITERIPHRIPEPDRTWIALATYNIGVGHLEDARRIAQGRGFDPDRWVHVRDSLPLLTQERWYRETRYGYARGWEPVRFVDNVRRYFEVLAWITAEETANVAARREEEFSRGVAETRIVLGHGQTGAGAETRDGTTGMKIATIAVELMMEPTMPTDAISNTMSRTSLPPDVRVIQSPRRRAMPVRTSPSPSTNSSAMRTMFGSENPAMASEIVITPVSGGAAIISKATTSMRGRLRMNITTADASRSRMMVKSGLISMHSCPAGLPSRNPVPKTVGMLDGHEALCDRRRAPSCMATHDWMSMSHGTVQSRSKV